MGNVKAMVALGKIYEEGIGVRVDQLEAFRYYHKAAWKNEPQALYKFGQLFEKGIGVEEDSSPSKIAKQIIVCYKKAVEEGSSKAAVRLAQIYENREYNTKDEGKAQELYEKTIETEEEAMNYIGRQ